MNILLSSGSRTRFRNDLAAHRAHSVATDREYAERVLGISVNTLKKLLNTQERSPLTLKRQTFVAICSNAALDPAAYNVPVTIPLKATPFGGYGRQDYDYLEGTYLIYRRSFLTAANVIRGALQIEWDEKARGLAFIEQHSYETDSGAPYQAAYRGYIHIRKDRNIIGFLQLANGEARLMLCGLPERPHGGGQPVRLRSRGALLTYGNPRDVYQPIVTTVLLEQTSAASCGDLMALCKTLAKGTPEHNKISAGLKHAEEHSVVMTPLMWRSLGD